MMRPDRLRPVGAVGKLGCTQVETGVETEGVSKKTKKVVDNRPGILSFCPLVFRFPSSMVEQLTLNQLVPGSSPGGTTKFPPKALAAGGFS